MKQNITLTLPKLFVDELLECLNVNIEDWHKTKIYLEHGDIESDMPYVRECNNVIEAEQLETYYIDIKTNIETQIKKQA
jgi:hypothetical protein